MWGHRKNHSNHGKLSMFLEAIEGDEEEMVEGANPEARILALVKKGLSPDEVWEELSDESPGVLFAAAMRLVDQGKIEKSDVGIGGVDEEASSVSDAAEETNKKVQDAEDEEDAEESPEDGEDTETVGESFEIGDNPEDQEQMKEAQFARKDYNVVVDIILNASDKIAEEIGADGKQGKIKAILAQEFADVFQADNPRFDVDRFLNAIGE